MSNRAVLIQALEATPRDLARSVRPVAPEQALWRPGPADWSIAAVVAHLAEMEQRFLGRLQQVAAEDNPRVAPLHPDETRHDLALPLATLLDTFVANRGATLAFLQGLEQYQWNRPLVHPSSGPSTLREQVRLLVGHDNEHLAQIATLREQIAEQR